MDINDALIPGQEFDYAGDASESVEILQSTSSEPSADLGCLVTSPESPIDTFLMSILGSEKITFDMTANRPSEQQPDSNDYQSPNDAMSDPALVVGDIANIPIDLPEAPLSKLVCVCTTCNNYMKSSPATFPFPSLNKGTGRKWVDEFNRAKGVTKKLLFGSLSKFPHYGLCMRHFNLENDFKPKSETGGKLVLLETAIPNFAESNSNQLEKVPNATKKKSTRAERSSIPKDDPSDSPRELILRVRQPRSGAELRVLPTSGTAAVVDQKEKEFPVKRKQQEPVLMLRPGPGFKSLLTSSDPDA